MEDIEARVHIYPNELRNNVCAKLSNGKGCQLSDEGYCDKGSVNAPEAGVGICAALRAYEALMRARINNTEVGDEIEKLAQNTGIVEGFQVGKLIHHGGESTAQTSAEAQNLMRQYLTRYIEN